MTNDLTESDIDQVVAVLDKIDPQSPLPQKLFYAIMRIISNPVIEIVPWRVNPQTGQKEILFTRRTANDPTWPGKLHTPGVIVRPSDGDDYTNCIKRIARDELGKAEWEKLSYLLITMGGDVRGHGMGVAFAMKISSSMDMSKYGEWSPLGEFPDNCIQKQIPWLKKAVTLI